MYMNIDIFTKNVTISDALRTFTEQKIGSLGKYLSGSIVDARVELGKPSKHHRSGPVFYAEVNLKIGGKLLRAEATHLDLRTAIIKVKDELEVQIRKLKGKVADSSRRVKK